MHIKDFLPYTLPFIVFAVLTYVLKYIVADSIFIYPVKTVLVSGLLIFFFRDIKNEIVLRFDVSAIAAGIFVFVIWIGLEGFYPLMGNDDSFNPFENSAGSQIYFFIAIRLFGASIIVPLIEELFWRSFAMRFLIDSNFKKVLPGTFTWFSFIAVAIAFGFEHYRWLPGIIAGIVYGWLYIRSKNLFSPILSHAVTNFLLGIYVLYSGHWSFW